MTDPLTAEIAGRNEWRGDVSMIGGVREVRTDRFAPIGLDELVDQAELMTRVDRKYLVSIDVAAAVVPELDLRTRVLEIDGKRDFAYDSVYFDTEDDLAYRLTAQQRRRRFKVRTRSYLDTGGCFLEVKTKSGRGATVKQRTGYASEDRARLTSHGRDYVGRVLGAQGHAASLVERLRPRLISRYHRSTLLLPEGSRATIDTELQWFEVDRERGGDREPGCGPSETVRLTAHAIIETKSVGSTSELDRALWRAGHRPTSISKFGAGTAALRPELPSNKWSRQLRVPFSISHQ